MSDGGRKNSTILRFKAGKADYDEETHKVTPRAVKGELIFKPTDEEEFMYQASWVAREKTAGAPDPDDSEIMIIPGDVVWKHVKLCKTGRVFCLHFSSGNKMFFWMQEKNDNEEDPSELSKKDKEICARLDEIMDENALAA